MSYKVGMRTVRKLQRYGGRRYRRVRRRPASAGVKALKKVNYLKKQIGPVEMKYSSATNASYQSISSSGYTTGLFTSISQDASDDGRVGDSLFAKYLHLRFQLANPADAENNVCRIVIVRDKLNLGATAATMNPNNGTILAPITELAPDIVGPGRQSEVLFDKTYTWPLQAPSAEGMIVENLRFKLNKPIGFLDNGTTINKNNYRIYCWSAVTTNTPAILLVSRLDYTDC